MKYLILRGIFKSRRYNKFVFEKPVCIKNKYIDRTVYNPVEVKDQIEESWPRNLSDKEDSIEMTSDFSLHNNKPVPLLKVF
jgi:hypothetical protein